SDNNIQQSSTTTIITSETTSSNAHVSTTDLSEEHQFHGAINPNSRTTHEHAEDTESQSGSTRRSSWQTSAIP
ncbi:hypothetical protein BGZ46_004923, partial [Entomortierella lignicola]